MVGIIVVSLDHVRYFFNLNSTRFQHRFIVEIIVVSFSTSISVNDEIRLDFDPSRKVFDLCSVFINVISPSILLSKFRWSLSDFFRPEFNVEISSDDFPFFSNEIQPDFDVEIRLKVCQITLNLGRNLVDFNYRPEIAVISTDHLLVGGGEIWTLESWSGENVLVKWFPIICSNNLCLARR